MSIDHPPQNSEIILPNPSTRTIIIYITIWSRLAQGISINGVKPMAKASKGRSRSAARKLKDKWRSKQWYSIIAPDIFDRKVIGQTPCDEVQKLTGRNVEVSLQNLTGNYRQSHIKLRCKITSVSGLNANTIFMGHHLTTEYTKRLVQRRKSKMNGIMDVVTKDGGKVRVKLLLTTNRRVNSSKQSLIVKTVNNFVVRYARNKLFSQLISDILSNTLSIQVFRYVKPVYPLKRVEVYKSEVLRFLSPHLAVKEERDFDASEEKSADREESVEDKEREEMPEPQVSPDESETTGEEETNEKEESEEVEPLEASKELGNETEKGSENETGSREETELPEEESFPEEKHEE